MLPQVSNNPCACPTSVSSNTPVQSKPAILEKILVIALAICSLGVVAGAICCASVPVIGLSMVLGCLAGSLVCLCLSYCCKSKVIEKEPEGLIESKLESKPEPKPEPKLQPQPTPAPIALPYAPLNVASISCHTPGHGSKGAVKLVDLSDPKNVKVLDGAKKLSSKENKSGPVHLPDSSDAIRFLGQGFAAIGKAAKVIVWDSCFPSYWFPEKNK